MRALVVAASVGAVNGYSERVIKYAGPRVQDGRLLKEYLISARALEPASVVVHAGRSAVAASLAASAPAGAPAFCVIHEGEDACYYLAYWWAQGCILHGRADTARLDAPDDTSPLSSRRCLHVGACPGGAREPGMGAPRAQGNRTAGHGAVGFGRMVGQRLVRWRSEPMSRASRG